MSCTSGVVDKQEAAVIGCTPRFTPHFFVSRLPKSCPQEDPKGLKSDDLESWHLM